MFRPGSARKTGALGAVYPTGPLQIPQWIGYTVYRAFHGFMGARTDTGIQGLPREHPGESHFGWEPVELLCRSEESANTLASFLSSQYPKLDGGDLCDC
jgi:hypothetical protein